MDPLCLMQNSGSDCVSHSQHRLRYARRKRSVPLPNHAYDVTDIDISARKCSEEKLLGYWSEELFRIFGRDPVTGSLSLEETIEQCIHPDDRRSQPNVMRTKQSPETMIPSGKFELSGLTAVFVTSRRLRAFVRAWVIGPTNYLAL